MNADQRFPCKHIIVEIMRDYGYMDPPGMGARRKIVPLTRDFSDKEAVFELSVDYLRVVIPARPFT